MPGASCAFSPKLAVELLKPNPMSASWFVLTLFTITGVAVLWCVSDCTCDVKPAVKSSLKPVNSTPGSLLVSKTFSPRLSCGRKYCIAIGRPFVQESFAAAAAAAAAGSAAGTGVAASVVGVGDGAEPPSEPGCARAGEASTSRVLSVVARRIVEVMVVVLVDG